MRNNSTSMTGYFEHAVPRYLPYELKDHFRMTTRTFQFRQSRRQSRYNSQNIHLAREAAADLLQMHMDMPE